MRLPLAPDEKTSDERVAVHRSVRKQGKVMFRRIDSDRRRFLSTAVFAAVAAGLPRIGSTQPNTSPSLGPLKQVSAGVLNVGYADVGPSSGRPVILLHG